MADPDLFFRTASETPSVINEKKTQVNHSFCNINSTLFEVSPRGTVHVPFLRPKQLYPLTPTNIGGSVREATKWLEPGSRLQRRTFDVLMRQAARTVVDFGWSFRKAGFFGQKQTQWLQKHGFLSRYETRIHAYQPCESEVPTQISPTAEPVVPLAEKHRGFIPFASELTILWNAVMRFELPKFLPKKKEVWDEEKALWADRFRWRQCEVSRAKRYVRGMRMCGVVGLMPHRQAGSLRTSAQQVAPVYPLPVADVVIASQKRHCRLVKDRLMAVRLDKVTIPAGIAYLLDEALASSDPIGERSGEIPDGRLSRYIPAPDPKGFEGWAYSPLKEEVDALRVKQVSIHDAVANRVRNIFLQGVKAVTL